MTLSWCVGPWWPLFALHRKAGEQGREVGEVSYWIAASNFVTFSRGMMALIWRPYETWGFLMLHGPSPQVLRTIFAFVSIRLMHGTSDGRMTSRVHSSAGTSAL